MEQVLSQPSVDSLITCTRILAHQVASSQRTSTADSLGGQEDLPEKFKEPVELALDEIRSVKDLGFGMASTGDFGGRRDENKDRRSDSFSASSSVLAALLDDVSHEGLRNEDGSKSRRENDTIRYLSIASREAGEADEGVAGSYAVGVFVIPPGVRIPLHDHPRMMGFIRILEGSVFLRSYDHHSSDAGTGCSGTSPNGFLTVQQRAARWLTAPCTATLEPVTGNLHELEAGEGGCTMLDGKSNFFLFVCLFFVLSTQLLCSGAVLVPNYGDEADGEGCNFYRAAVGDDTERPNIGGDGSGTVAQKDSGCALKKVVMITPEEADVFIEETQWPVVMESCKSVLKAKPHRPIVDGGGASEDSR